jgi:hypothetical protein
MSSLRFLYMRMKQRKKVENAVLDIVPSQKAESDFGRLREKQRLPSKENIVISLPARIMLFPRGMAMFNEDNKLPPTQNQKLTKILSLNNESSSIKIQATYHHHSCQISKDNSRDATTHAVRF